MVNSPRATIDIDDDEDVDLERDRSPTEIAEDGDSDVKEDDRRDVLTHPDENGGGGNGDQRGEGMQVEGANIYLGALGEVEGATVLSPPPEIKDNRKRGRSHAERELKEEPDEDESESPSKKASTDAAPVSGRELRALLASHLLEMKGQIGSRISQVEAAQQRQAQDVVNLQGKTITVEKEIGNLKGRTTANEKHVGELKTMVDLHEDRINEVTTSLARLQSDLQSRPMSSNGGPPGPVIPSDPWANWTANHPQTQKKSGPLSRAQWGDMEDDNILTEEEKRTLIVGGWAQDTKKATIETESRELLARDEIKGLVDEPVLAVYGPRRSVGSLKFDYRHNETFQSLRDRMWKTMKAIRELAVKFPSARDLPSSKPAWASFVKTKEARRRTMLVSQTRRVCIQLATDATSDAGGPCKPAAINTESYDVDWGSGTIWHESSKIASATHRQPVPNTAVIVMPGGWVNLKAVMDVTGCTETEARCAFEREL